MKSAFTLIELLVVITIIVVLLALLTPALDKAIYQAELLNCGAGNLNMMGKGVTTYAMNNRRHYPDRRIASVGYQEPGRLPINPQTVKRYSVGYDIRPLHSTIFAINQTLQCPLSPHIELENETVTSEDVGLDASYAMWWAWQYKGENKSFAGMFRFGNRWGYDDLDSPVVNKVNRFDVLAGDIDLIWGGGGANPAQASHPDREPATMTELQSEEEWFIERASVGRWWGPRNRGVLDTNYVFEDGSVARYEGVTRVNFGPGHPDYYERMARVPINIDHYNDRGFNVDKMHVPLR